MHALSYNNIGAHAGTGSSTNTPPKPAETLANPPIPPATLRQKGIAGIFAGQAWHIAGQEWHIAGQAWHVAGQAWHIAGQAWHIAERHGILQGRHGIL